jgi:hypothetical protein
MAPTSGPVSGSDLGKDVVARLHAERPLQDRPAKRGPALVSVARASTHQRPPMDLLKTDAYCGMQEPSPLRPLLRARRAQPSTPGSRASPSGAIQDTLTSIILVPLKQPLLDRPVLSDRALDAYSGETTRLLVSARTEN